MDNKLILSSAIASLVAFSALSGTASAGEKKWGKEKCYGVSLKEKNDCSTAKHDCSTLSKTDYSLDEWKYVPKGTCDDIKKALVKDGKIKETSAPVEQSKSK